MVGYRKKIYKSIFINSVNNINKAHVQWVINSLLRQTMFLLLINQIEMKKGKIYHVQYTISGRLRKNNDSGKNARL